MPPDEKFSLAVRVWKNKTLLLEDRIQASDQEMDTLIPQLAMKHASAVEGADHMIEIEFLDEPDPLQRYFRFGTDPSGMVKPIEVNLRNAPC